MSERPDKAKTFDDDKVWGEPIVRCRDCELFGADESTLALGFCFGKGMVASRWPRTEPVRRANDCPHFSPLVEAQQ